MTNTFITKAWLAKQAAHQIRSVCRFRLRIRHRPRRPPRLISIDIPMAWLYRPADEIADYMKPFAHRVRSYRPKYIYPLSIDLPGVSAYRADGRNVSARAIEQWDPSGARIRVECLVSR